MNGEISSGSSNSSKVERHLEPWDGGCSGDELELSTEINGGKYTGLSSRLPRVGTNPLFCGVRGYTGQCNTSYHS